MTYLYKRVTDVCSFMLMAVLTSVATSRTRHGGEGGYFRRKYGVIMQTAHTHKIQKVHNASNF